MLNTNQVVANIYSVETRNGVPTMSLTMAKKRAKPGGGPGKRRPGRPETGIPTKPLSARAPLTLHEAFEFLSAARGGKRKAGGELLRAAESHLVAMYWNIKDNPASKLLTARFVQPFLSAAEAYFDESGGGIPPRPDRSS